VAHSTAWAVISCIEAKRPPALLVENVADFLKWKLYPQWKLCLEVLGYHISENILNAADLGSRKSG
jgi:DNA (cytosine-5)-methyltransferase 1